MFATHQYILEGKALPCPYHLSHSFFKLRHCLAPTICRILFSNWYIALPLPSVAFFFQIGISLKYLATAKLAEDIFQLVLICRIEETSASVLVVIVGS